jgi:hypothetical protein
MLLLKYFLKLQLLNLSVVSQKNGNKDKLVESNNLMPLDEIMKEKGYCEECGN